MHRHTHKYRNTQTREKEKKGKQCRPEVGSSLLSCVERTNSNNNNRKKKKGRDERASPSPSLLYNEALVHDSESRIRTYRLKAVKIHTHTKKNGDEYVHRLREKTRNRERKKDTT